MSYSPLRSAGCIAALGAAVALAGCQSYEQQPLDPATHRAAWHGRTPTDPGVTDFARWLQRSGASDAGPYDPSDGIDAGEAELIALVYNPDLRLERLRAGVAAAMADHAGRWDDPRLGVDLLRITENVPDPWIFSTGLAITLPISGRLEAEQARADAAYRAELFAVAEQEWRVRHEVRRAWLEWSAMKLRAEQQARLIERIGGLIEATQKLADAGELPPTEAGLFVLERAQRRHELRRMRGRVEVSEQRLRALMGLSPKAALSLTAGLDVVMPSEADRDGRVSVDHHPSLAQREQAYAVAEEKLRREVRKQYPDLTIGPVAGEEEGQSRIGLSGGVPLSILNANKQGIAEAKAERELARAAYETAYEQLVGSLAQARANASALRAERELIAEELAPLVDRQVADARRLLELGEGGALVLLESLVRAHRARLQLIDVRLDEARANAEVRYLAPPDHKTKTNPNPPSADSAEEVSP